MPEREESGEREVVHVLLPRGAVVMPAWLVFFLCASFILSTVGLCLTWVTNRQLVGEIRVLQLAVEDVENYLIKHAGATPADFAPRRPREGTAE